MVQLVIQYTRTCTECLLGTVDLQHIICFSYFKNLHTEAATFGPSQTYFLRCFLYFQLFDPNLSSYQVHKHLMKLQKLCPEIREMMYLKNQ